MKMGRGLIAMWVISISLFGMSGAATAETLLERGAYLMRSVVACGNCHTLGSLEGRPAAGMELAGGNVWDEKPFTAYAPNITPDKETGIGSWTDEQIIASIREGKRPDGSIIGPPMPIGLYRGISDRDARAIVAYLRKVKPIRNKVPRSVYRIPLPPAYGPPVRSVPEVPRSDKVRYGAYLSGPLGHCIECHTPFAKPGQRDFKNRLAGGGFVITGMWGTTVAANITPDKETGIGKWSDRQIKAAITTGYRASGEKMYPPMGYRFYQNIRREDLDAIVAYLRSLKPVRYERKFRHVPKKK